MSIVGLGFKLKIAFVEKLVETAKDSGLSWTVGGGGTTFTSDILGGLRIEYTGTGFGTDGSGKLNAGTITDFSITKVSSGKISNMQLQNSVTASNFWLNLDLGFGGAKFQNYIDFYDLLIPTIVTTTGSKFSDKIDGGSGDDNLSGGKGKDTFLLGAGNDTINGDAGRDTVSGENLGTKVNVDLKKGWVKYGGDTATLTSVENATGTSKNDKIKGDNGANVLEGGGGKDTLIGRGGDDTLVGGAGRDELYGGGGEDNLHGGTGDDLIFGDKGDDSLYGSKGKDFLYGGKGDDFLDGGANNDNLYGGSGNDILLGGKGDDKLEGGAGNDVFVFKKNEGKDKILDFEDGKDKINLAGFGFANKAQALSKFVEIGTGYDNKVKFVDQGTTIIIKGIDLGDLSGADIII